MLFFPPKIPVLLRQSKNSLVITELLFKSGQFLGYVNDRAFEELLRGRCIVTRCDQLLSNVTN